MVAGEAEWSPVDSLPCLVVAAGCCLERVGSPLPASPVQEARPASSRRGSHAAPGSDLSSFLPSLISHWPEQVSGLIPGSRGRMRLPSRWRRGSKASAAIFNLPHTGP